MTEQPPEKQSIRKAAEEAGRLAAQKGLATNNKEVREVQDRVEEILEEAEKQGKLGYDEFGNPYPLP